MTSTTLEELSTSDRAQLERVEDFFVNASVGFHIADPEGRVTSANRALALLLGFDDRVELDGVRFADLFVDGDVARDVIVRAQSGETITNVKTLLRGADEEPRQAIVNVSGRFEDGGLTATRWIVRPHLEHTIPSVESGGGAFVDAASDSDAAQWAARLMEEVDVRPSIDEMSAGEQRERLAELEDFFEHAPAAIHCVALNGDVVQANKTDLANVGYLDTPKEYLGHHIMQVYADQALLEDLLVRLSGGTPIVNVRSRLRRKDGQLLPVVIYSSGRVSNGSFENTRCVVFEDHDPTAEPTSLRSFSWPPTD